MSLADVLRSGRVLLMDGAMGTELLRAGWKAEDGLERLNGDHPEQVRTIHRAYAAAGAEVLLTNTFQAGRSADPRPVYQQAVRLAREAAAGAYILADVGPGRPLDIVQMDDAIRGCADADGILLETWSDPRRLPKPRDERRESRGSPPLLVSFTYRRGPDGELRTFHDATPEQCATAASAAGAVALGVNCGLEIGLDELLEIVTRYRTATDMALFARPNAGTPKGNGAAAQYPHTPAVMAAWLPPLFEAGVTMIGGCCGTTPAHITAFRKIVDEWNSDTR